MVIVGQFEIHNPQQEQDTESGAIEAASNEWMLHFLYSEKETKEKKERKRRKEQLDIILAGMKQPFVNWKQRRKMHPATQDIPDTKYEKQITK